MSQPRYSYTDSDGNTHGLMTLDDLRLKADRGEIAPDATIMDIPKVISRRADSIPGLFPGQFVTEGPKDGALNESERIGNDLVVTNLTILSVISIVSSAFYPMIADRLAGGTKPEPDAYQQLINPTSTWLWWAVYVLQFMLLGYGAFLMMKSRKLGFVIVAVGGFALFRSSYASFSRNNPFEWAGSLGSLILFTATIYAVARLVGAIGPKLES